MRCMKSGPVLPVDDGGPEGSGSRVRDRRQAAMTRAWRKFCMYNREGAVKKKGGGSEFGGLTAGSSGVVFLAVDIGLVGRLHETGDIEHKA